MSQPQVITDTETIDLLASQLRKSDNDLYVFQPEGEERFFIGEALIVAIATELLKAFFKAFASALQEKTNGLATRLGKESGEKIGDWVVGRIQSLWRAPSSPISDFNKDAAVAKAAAAKAPAGDRLQAVEEALALIQKTCTARGMTEGGAAAITAKIRAVAIPLVQV